MTAYEEKIKYRKEVIELLNAIKGELTSIRENTTRDED